MKVLLCHNHYQHSGGEDRVFWDEAELLESRGHDVWKFTLHNDAIEGMRRLDVAKKTLWNSDSANQLRKLILQRRPDVMHCTNIFPLISPSAYYVAKEEGVGVIQSLHNYRLLCPKAPLVRDGKVCEKCVGRRVAWPAIRHACYKESRSASAVVAAMLAYHRFKQTWSTMVDRYVAPTRFVKDKYVQGGWPADKIDVKPNFVFTDPGSGDGGGNYAIFVGRLSPEKGIDVLLEAWSTLDLDVPLKIVGDGPLADQVQRAAATDPRIEWLRRQDPSTVLSLLGEARCLLMPSICYETFGLTIVEAFAKGTPVIVSDLGAMSELVDDGRTGLLARPGDANDLASKVRQMFAGDPATFRDQARGEFERKYTSEQNHDRLLDIYQRAIDAPEAPALCAVC